ncbi:MAG: hypothetical protein PHP67_08365 [Sphaerochaeta sp.]|nr:hypothetical protein [Sphaerochaeta sp.]
MKHTMILLLFLVLLAGAAPLLAVDYSPENEVYAQTAEPFIGTNVRMLGMGGAGLAVRGYHDSFLVNPANMAKSGFKFSLPSVTVTAFNAKAILESGAIEDFTGESEDGDMTSGIEKLLNTIRKGYGDVLTTDLSTSFSVGSFGFSLQAQERLMSFKESYGFDTINLIAQVTTAATAGFGFRIQAIPDVMSIDLGLSAQMVYKAYLEAVSAETLMGSFDDPSVLMSGTPLVAGYALPLSFGVNMNLPAGLTISAAAKNLNGNYTMSTYQSLNDWGQEVLDAEFGEDTSDDSTFTSESITIESDWRLDTGLAWAPDIGSLLRPVVAVDVVDVMQLSGKQGDELTNALLSQTRFGASVRLLGLLDFRYGLNQGYQSIGVGFDLLIFHIDAAYYSLEYGSKINGKPIDALSLSFSLFSR